VHPAENGLPAQRAKIGPSSEPVKLSYEKQKVKEDKLGEYSASSSSKFMFKHSYRDVGRKKFHFCLSFCSVFVVVWSALVINTLV